MEIGVLYIFVFGIIITPIVGMIQRTKAWKDFENKFFFNHNHYM